MTWDGTRRESFDISAAFAHDHDGTAERSLAAMAWSPDGSRLAVGTHRPDGDEGSYCGPGAIAWSPDGSRTALVSSVRRRRRKLALLKTFGFSRRQVRASVAWQATALALIGLGLASRWGWPWAT